MPGDLPTLGRLQRVDVRSVWSHEAHVFTPWLAQSDNLQELARSLELSGLELIQTEQGVEEFSADIVAKVPETGEIVLIENQLERSDHSHLGQLLTYAAGTDAVAIVWVTPKFASGHRAAMDWLNRNTNDRLAFFAVEVEAWRIGDSSPAPKFNVVVQPNNWARAMRASVRSTDDTLITAANVEYWAAFHDRALEEDAPTRPTNAPVKGNNYYVYFDPPMKWCYLSAYISRSTNRVGVYLALASSEERDDTEAVYDELAKKQSELERKLGQAIDYWNKGVAGKPSHIGVRLLDCDPDDQADWERQHGWLANQLKGLYRVFHERLIDYAKFD